MKTLSDIGHTMVWLLHKRDDVLNPKYRSGVISWIIERDGWLTPVWTHITYYSTPEDIVRFRNDHTTKLPKNQWMYDLPDQFHFELNATIEELDYDILGEVIEYCELARKQPASKFDRHPPRFPKGADHGGYGWTVKSWELQNKRDKG